MNQPSEETLKKIEENLNKLNDDIIFLNTNISIIEKILENYDSIFRHYSNFIFFLIFNIFLSSILVINKFFDKRNDSTSLYWFFSYDPSLKEKENDLLKKIEEFEKENSGLKKIRNKYLAHSDANEKLSTVNFLDNKDIQKEYKNFRLIIKSLNDFIKQIENFYFCFYILKRFSVSNKIRIAPTYNSREGIEGVVDDFNRMINKIRSYDLNLNK
ncbi:MAG: hypothetical protein NZ822_01680 [Patescibacteria group bacterium]|nr:hypothetical protein [Patescibacteria group bacterium]